MIRHRQMAQDRIGRSPAEYPALLDSIHRVLILCTALSVLGIFVSLARGERERGRQYEVIFPRRSIMSGA